MDLEVGNYTDLYTGNTFSTLGQLPTGGRHPACSYPNATNQLLTCGTIYLRTADVPAPGKRVENKLSSHTCLHTHAAPHL